MYILYVVLLITWIPMNTYWYQIHLCIYSRLSKKYNCLERILFSRKQFMESFSSKLQDLWGFGLDWNQLVGVNKQICFCGNGSKTFLSARLFVSRIRRCLASGHSGIVIFQVLRINVRWCVGERARTWKGGIWSIRVVISELWQIRDWTTGVSLEGSEWLHLGVGCQWNFFLSVTVNKLRV